MFQAKFILKTKGGDVLKYKTKVYSSEIKLGERINYYIYKLYKEKDILKLKIVKINLETLFFEYIYLDDKKRQKTSNKSYLSAYKNYMSKRDYQRERVYKWEADNLNRYGIYSSPFSMEKMNAFCIYVLNCLDIPEIDINHIGEANRSFFKFQKIGDNEVLSLNFSSLALNKILAIHELSHYIVYYKKLPDMGHGKYFVGIYAYLLINFIGFGSDGVYNTIKSRGIDCISYEDAEYYLNTK